MSTLGLIMTETRQDIAKTKNDLRSIREKLDRQILENGDYEQKLNELPRKTMQHTAENLAQAVPLENAQLALINRRIPQRQQPPTQQEKQLITSQIQNFPYQNFSNPSYHPNYHQIPGRPDYMASMQNASLNPSFESDRQNQPRNFTKPISQSGPRQSQQNNEAPGNFLQFQNTFSYIRPRLPKIPFFDKENAIDWLDKFELMTTTLQAFEKVQLLSAYMGQEETWHLNHLDVFNSTNWEEAKHRFIEHYDTRKDYFTETTKFHSTTQKTTENGLQYVERKIRMAQKLKYPPPIQPIIENIIAGLDSSIRAAVYNRTPKTYAELRSAVKRAQDDSHILQPKSFGSQLSINSNMIDDEIGKKLINSIQKLSLEQQRNQTNQVTFANDTSSRHKSRREEYDYRNGKRNSRNSSRDPTPYYNGRISSSYDRNYSKDKYGSKDRSFSRDRRHSRDRYYNRSHSRDRYYNRSYNRDHYYNDRRYNSKDRYSNDRNQSSSRERYYKDKQGSDGVRNYSRERDGRKNRYYGRDSDRNFSRERSKDKYQSKRNSSKNRDGKYQRDRSKTPENRRKNRNSEDENESKN